jgi:hypothetical protein
LKRQTRWSAFRETKSRGIQKVKALTYDPAHKPDRLVKILEKKSFKGIRQKGSTHALTSGITLEPKKILSEIYLPLGVTASISITILASNFGSILNSFFTRLNTISFALVLSNNPSLRALINT